MEPYCAWRAPRHHVATHERVVTFAAYPATAAEGERKNPAPALAVAALLHAQGRLRVVERPDLAVYLDGQELPTPRLSSELVAEVCQWMVEDGLSGVETIIEDARRRIALP